MSFYFAQGRSYRKCAVIGCCTLGAAVAHALLQYCSTDALVLIDPDPKCADSLAADLHCAMPFYGKTDVWAGDYHDLAECSLIVLALGHVNLHEDAHGDLAAMNIPIIKKAAGEIAANHQDAVILVLGNPNEILTHTYLNCFGASAQKIIGIGTLPQTICLRSLIANYLGADVRQVDAMILGQSDGHGVFFAENVRVNGIEIQSYLQSMGRSFDGHIIQSLFEDTMHAFARAENRTGRAEYAIARSCAIIASCIFDDTGTLLPLCVHSDGWQDLLNVCMTLPCKLGKHGARVLSESTVPAQELDLLRRTAARLHARIMDADSMHI